MEFRLRLISHANENLWIKAALEWVLTIWQINKSRTKQSRNQSCLSQDHMARKKLGELVLACPGGALGTIQFKNPRQIRVSHSLAAFTQGNCARFMCNLLQFLSALEKLCIHQIRCQSLCSFLYLHLQNPCPKWRKHGKDKNAGLEVH